MSKILLLELNEVNFDFIRHYVDAGLLPNFADLLELHGMVLTTSEDKYEEIEPWIQWVSAHTGKAFADHGVYRLGDVIGRDLRQIWEYLEDAGLRVGAVCPMNAENRTRRAAFFVPDPWTGTHTTGGMLLHRLHAALRQAVNDNARSHLSVETLLWLLAGVARYARLVSLVRYARYTSRSGRQPWHKALFLDLFLSDLFISEVKRTSPDFASLFLNAGAHIQHHYMFNAAPYSGDQSNPSWYISETADPLLDVYKLYDKILGDLRRSFPDRRFIIVTGLHQDPHPEPTFYWRLTNHGRFLRRIGIDFEQVEPRMSRDFLVKCATVERAQAAACRFNSLRGEDGIQLFEVDNRGTDLFVTMSYPKNVPAGFGFHVGLERFENLRGEIDFVAIKNGQHNGVGYLIDTARTNDAEQLLMELTALPEVICNGFGLDWGQSEEL